MWDVSTNHLGEFRLAGVAPGRYFLRARLPVINSWTASTVGAGGPRPARRQGAEQSYIPVYYPNSPDVDSAAPISLAPGQSLQDIDLYLRRANVYRIRGRVLVRRPTDINDPQNGSATTLCLIPASGGPRVTDRREIPVQSRDGSFEVASVRPGRYHLILHQSDLDRQRSARAFVDVGEADVDNIELEATQSHPLTGLISVEGRPAPFALSSIFLDLQEVVNSYRFTAYARPKDDGTFVTSLVTDGRYWLLTPGLPGGYYVKSVRLAGRDVTGSSFEVGGGGELKIVIAPGAPAIRGVVVDDKDKPVPNATISVAPDATKSDHWELFQTTRSNQDGAFEMTVPPGDDRVYAWENIEWGDHQDPQILERFKSKSSSAKLGVNDNQTLQLKLIPASEI